MSSRAQLGVLQDSGDGRRSRQLSTNHYGAYAAEILEHAGIPFEPLERSRLTGTDLPRLLLIPYRVRLSNAEVEALQAHAEGGGAVMIAGGVEGADALFAVKTSRRQLSEGRLRWPEGGLGLAAGGALPIWGGQLAVPEGQQGEDSLVLGEVVSSDGAIGTALTLRRVGDGVACYLAVDVARSVVEMQQGVPVLGDAGSAPDGTAPLEDGILKSDDGAVIDWNLRQEGPEGAAFLTPYADILRELLLTALRECAIVCGTVLPMVWYWPDGKPAVAALSYDTDSNEDRDGRAFLAVVADLSVHGTWCVMYPGGYERETYDAIREYGDEIALHFDALTSDLNGAAHCGWSQDDFDYQLSWLKQETGVSKVISQKNHVTRWEGWLELFRWLEEAEVAVDQTKGPSKVGNLGFNFGTCHPWRPMEDASSGNRLMNVLELGFHTHDMHHSSKRVELRRRLLDAARARAGVAHFIFHPQRIHEPGQPEAIADIVGYARELGIDWWTSEQVWRWETARRQARVEVEQEGDGGVKLRVRQAPEGFTLLLLGLGEGVVASDGPRVELVEVMGRPAHRLIVPAGDSETQLRPAGAAQGV